MKSHPDAAPLARTDADAPADLLLRPIVDEWSETAHANAGVNCRGCHDVTSPDGKVREWRNRLDHEACRSCHPTYVSGFLKGRHGMRLAQGMSAMRPGMARLKMHDDASHKELNCSACHASHRFDATFAAVDACIGCHDDQHSRNYLDSPHYELWKEEVSGGSNEGRGVSCATCHMPRIQNDDGVVEVQHNQNDNLRPNEKMIRSVCMSCHGLEFSLASLADSLLMKNCFRGAPSASIDSAQMAKRWFEERKRKREEKKKEG